MIIPTGLEIIRTNNSVVAVARVVDLESKMRESEMTHGYLTWQFMIIPTGLEIIRTNNSAIEFI